ncbi:cilia- and flagella-associated protein 43 isoform X1 [Diabrotica virgifera virgifera]|uniref:Cilia- and flagella-associated protein 43 n=1 Tax=Diabrotica virgifera virgifera TaxID=50390 RepID=A0ABM5KC46_DIAVI|nr:cilia- and flagella-associated protein 43 isoform X1 [Diabrotica virgifera virgifera]
MKSTDNPVVWAKVGRVKFVSLISKDVVCYGNECFAMFFHLTTQDEQVLVANLPSGNGDGINEVRGHKSHYVFAYSENCDNARVFIKNYPEFETIQIFHEAFSQGYISMTFAETSLFITLGELPKFTITVWNWRTNKKLGQSDTNMHTREQVIRCNWNKPVHMVQLGVDTKEVYFWDLYTCCKEIVIHERQVQVTHVDNLSFFTHAMWTTEGGLFICDTKGNLYTVDFEFNLERVIEVNLEGSGTPSLTWYKGGIVVAGPDKVIRHYKKLGTWSCDWTIDLESPVHRIASVKSEYLIVNDEDGELMKLTETEDALSLTSTSVAISDFCMIYPLGDYIVALRKQTNLVVFKVETGEQMSGMTLKSAATTIDANPVYPYLAVSFQNGLVELVSIYNPLKLTSMCNFHLSEKPIDKIRFFEHGQILVTADHKTGDIFIIEGVPGTQMQVNCHVEVKQQIADFILVASKTCLRLFVLPVTSKYLAGNKIIRYCIIGKETVNIKEYYFEPTGTLYSYLSPIQGPLRDRIFFAVPFASKNLHQLETRRGESTAKVIREIKTGHQLRSYQFRHMDNFTITWGFDGFILVRDAKFEKQIAVVVAHHRYQGGVKKAYVDALGRYVVSLGVDKILCCTKINNFKVDEALRYDQESLLSSSKFASMFRRPTLGFKPEGAYLNKTWLEVYEIERVLKEEAFCKAEKNEILEEFYSIQSTLKSLVTSNLRAADIEKIDLLEFYLDTNTYNQRKAKNREECRKTETYLKALIEAQNIVSQYVTKTYWDPMGVRGKVVRGIFQKTIATIYTLLPRNEASIRRLAWVEEQRKIEEFLSVNCIFEPWLKIPPEELLAQMKYRPKYNNQDYITMQARGLLEDTTSKISIESQIALVGAVTSLYVERNPWHYKQRQLVSFYQCDLQQAIAESEVIKLKQHYNVVFNAMAETKEREMESIKEKHERLRHIIREYNHFTDKKITFEIEDPQWTQEEIPTMFLEVQEDELTITPYISPSEQAILDAKAAEEERIRLALLADDFKERALMVMMNGVLEIKWEDEIKKDVPLPDCMIDKDPADFNEEDLRAVRDYEEKVIILNGEREKYKNMLEVDFTKISTNLRDSIRKFNQKTKDCVEYKMYIDSGMNQENLRVNRARLCQNERIKLYLTEDIINLTIRENETVIERLQETIKRLNEVLNECRANLDNLLLKEKVLEKTFKRDFQEFSTLVQEQATKLYKRRPRASFRGVNTETVLLELAKCLITQEKSLLLTTECIEFLKSLDHLDEFVGLPPTIDEHTFRLICKHRRSRIEFEIKVKAAQMQITDGETTIASCQKRLTYKKEKNIRLGGEIRKCKTDYLYLMHNIQIQIVLRRGLVEIPLTGDLADFKDAVLVPKREIEQINALIKVAGNMKLKTIRENMAFRRKIMATEWEHKKLRMTINDLIEQMNDINATKFLRDMQTYMKCKSRGRKQEIDSLEQEMEVIAAIFENNMREKKETLASVERQVQTYRDHNQHLDKTIQELNIDVCALKLKHDAELEVRESETCKVRMEGIWRRSELVQTIQKNHNQILVLQTELELLRLRTYPTFKYKLINTEEKI